MTKYQNLFWKPFVVEEKPFQYPIIFGGTNKETQIRDYFPCFFRVGALSFALSIMEYSHDNQACLQWGKENLYGFELKMIH